MAVPKNKTSKARRDRRRSAKSRLSTPNIVTCPKCGAFRMPHRVCKSCGTYKNREVIAVDSKK